MPSKFAPVPKFAPGRVAPQAARYWPGKPLKEDKESSDEYDSEEEEQEEVEEVPQQRQPSSQEKVPEAGTKLITTMKSTSISEQGPYQPPEVDSSEEEEEEENEVAEPDKRKLRQATKRAIGGFHATDQVDLDLEDEEEVVSDCGVTNSQSSEEESSEEEGSSDEEIAPRRPLMRPVFVSKYSLLRYISKDARNQRENPKSNGNNIGLANYGNSEDKEKNQNGDRKAEEAIKFLETEQRNAAQVAYEAEMHLEANRGIEAVDDTDNLDPAAEKAAWKLRELTRIKREREALIARELEREEIEKRRNMDEEERLKEDFARKREIEEERERNRPKMEFMQKWHHKGAFYQDDEVVKTKNTNVATAEEHRDKSNLPKPLQVRSGELGKASRSKYTHLADQDTSSKDSPWFDKDNSINKRTVRKMGGMHDPNDREKKRRRD